MTVTLAAALLAQVGALALLGHRLRRRWLRHPVALLVLTSVAYQGLSPLLLLIPSVSAQDSFRQGIAPQYSGDAALLLSAAMLAITIAYLTTRPERAHPGGEGARLPDWRLLAAACLPLAVATYAGRGYNHGHVTGAVPVTTNIASTFFAVLLVVAAGSFLLRYGTGWFLPVLAVQSALLLSAGERLPAIYGAVALVVVLAWAGAASSSRQVSAALGLTLLGVVALTGVRAEQGRMLYESDTGLTARVTALAGGLADGPAPDALVAEAATRLDGVSFTAGILQSEHMGQPGLAAAGVLESTLIAVPSVAWPSKLSHALNPVAAELGDFGLQRTNFLPGLPGMYAGFLSPPWLIAFMGLLGLLAGWGERWLLRECTPARLVILAGAVMAALSFEQGLQGMLIALRSALVLAVAVKVIEMVRGRNAPRHAASRQLVLAPLLTARMSR